MTEKKLNINEIVKHWRESADKDHQTMENLFSSGDYHWALFIGHLVVEKLLKALYVKRKGTHAVAGHDLLRLASKVDLVLTEEQKDWLDRLTTFNINARYNSYKQEFYKLCTKEFAEEWKNVIDNLRAWLLKQL